MRETQLHSGNTGASTEPTLNPYTERASLQKFATVGSAKVHSCVDLRNSYNLGVARKEAMAYIVALHQSIPRAQGKITSLPAFRLAALDLARLLAARS